MAARPHHLALTPAIAATLPRLAGFALHQQAFLAGGTACAILFQHRTSQDIDLFIGREFAPLDLSRSLSVHGIRHRISLAEPNTLYVITEQPRVKLSVIRYPGKVPRPWPDFQGIPMAPPVVLGAMKLLAIVNRGERKDFLDLYFLLSSRTIAWKPVLRRAMADFPGADAAIVLKALVQFGIADRQPQPSRCPVAWTAVKAFFVRLAQRAVRGAPP